MVGALRGGGFVFGESIERLSQLGDLCLFERAGQEAAQFLCCSVEVYQFEEGSGGSLLGVEPQAVQEPLVGKRLFDVLDMIGALLALRELSELVQSRGELRRTQVPSELVGQEILDDLSATGGLLLRAMLRVGESAQRSESCPFFRLCSSGKEAKEGPERGSVLQVLGAILKAPLAAEG